MSTSNKQALIAFSLEPNALTIKEVWAELDRKRVYEFYKDCGDEAPEDYFAKHQELSLNVRSIIYFLRYRYRGSEQTIHLYNRVIVEFLNHAKKNFNEILPKDITNFITYLTKERKLSVRSVRSYVASLKSFYKAMTDIGVLQGNPATMIGNRMAQEARKAQKKADGQLDGIQTKVLAFEKLPAWWKLLRSKAPLRDYAMLYFMFVTGVRVEELVGLKHEDLTYHGEKIGWELRVVGKGSKIRLLYVPKQAVDLFMEYRQATWRIPPYVEAEGILQMPMFTKIRGSINAHLSDNAVYRRVVKWGEAGGFGHVHPHCLRYTHGSILKQRGKSLEDIKHQLGHESLRVTLGYAHQDYRHNPPSKVLEEDLENADGYVPFEPIIFQMEGQQWEGIYCSTVPPGESPSWHLDRFITERTNAGETNFQFAQAPFRGAEPSKTPSLIVFTPKGLWDKPSFYLCRESLVRPKHP